VDRYHAPAPGLVQWGTPGPGDAVPRGQTESGLVADAQAVVRFLDSYLGGRRGYTALDVRAAVTRLGALCRRIEESPAADRGAAAVRALEAADECLRQVWQRLG